MRIDVIPVYQSYPSSATAPRAISPPREALEHHPQQPTVAPPTSTRFQAGTAEFARAELVHDNRPLTTNPHQAHAMQTFQAVADPEHNLHIIDIFA